MQSQLRMFCGVWILGFVTEKNLEFVFSFQWGTIIGWTGGGSYTKKKIYAWTTTLQAPCAWKAINILYCISQVVQEITTELLDLGISLISWVAY